MQAATTEGEPVRHNVIISAVLQLQGKLSPPPEAVREPTADDEPDFFEKMSCFA